tara:strand:+ start:832 stop:1524 length:693 start_codon:yes stop_codon:yes gene_type:complete
MRLDEIEATVTTLQHELWENQDMFLPNGCQDEVDLLNPRFAAAILGVKYEEVDHIPATFGFQGEYFKTAGLIDRQLNKIVVASDAKLPERRFTAAHELGHWVLHTDTVMHRDRPIGKLLSGNSTRAPKEREADYWGACFLMPRKLVKKRLKLNFGVDQPLRFDDNVANWLAPQDPGSLLYCGEESLNREFALATVERFNSQQFYSLSDQFRVSPTAMALRLKELKLIRWP